MVSRRRILQTTGTLTLASTAGCLFGGGEESEAALVTLTDGEQSVDAVTREHVGGVGNVDEGDADGTYTLALGLTDEGVTSLADAFESAGAADGSGDFEFRVHHDGDVLHSFPLESELVENVESGDYGGVFVVELGSRADAESLQSALEG